MTRFTMLISSIAVVCSVSAAKAEFATIEDQSDFLAIISGKELKRPFVNLEVLPGGQITGQGAAWGVTGNWTWKEGTFCRDLYWGGDPLGYNCQQVEAQRDRIRFTSDRGTGDSAEFRLR